METPNKTEIIEKLKPTTMKKITLILAIITVLVSCSNNDNYNYNYDVSKKTTEIDSTEIKKLIKFKEDSIEISKIKSYAITKISGRHKYSGKTMVSYQNFIQLTKETLSEGEKEMWSKTKIKEELSDIKSKPGGKIRLDVTRLTIGAADLEYFTIIVKDKNEKELFRKELDSSIPYPERSSDDWWNIDIISLDKIIKSGFYIYVVDELSDEVHKFEVTPKY